MGTVLKALLQQRHLQTVSAFNREYDRLASRFEPDLVTRGPRKAQFYRWLAGDITSGLPQPHHCRMLERMFPGWTVAELFASYDGPVADLAHRSADEPRPGTGPGPAMADVEEVYTSRVDFMRAWPPQELFKTASTIDMAGLSLNMLCQQYSDSDILRLLDAGAVIRCLFLDPQGAWIRARETEEGHPPGLLSSLTDTNIRTLEGIRNRTTASTSGRLVLGVYDQPIRFNITIIDSALCVIQPYMPAARGVDSPTFVARKSAGAGLFTTFSEVFDSLWADSTERQMQ